MAGWFGINFNIGFGNGFNNFWGMPGGFNTFCSPCNSFMMNPFILPVNNWTGTFDSSFNSIFTPIQFNSGFDYGFNPIFGSSWNNPFSFNVFGVNSTTSTSSSSSSSSNSTSNSSATSSSYHDNSSSKVSANSALDNIQNQSNAAKKSSAEISKSTASPAQNDEKPRSTILSDREKKVYGTLADYNSEKGQRLAQIALQNKESHSIKRCAKYVKNAIQEAGLGEYKLGHAFEMPTILRNNKNFKQISTDDVDVSKLPAGCILVYDRGVEGFSQKYGHTEITLGNGNAVSDFENKNIHKKPSNIFVPV